MDDDSAQLFCGHAERIAERLEYGLGLDPDRRPSGLPMAGPRN